MNRVTKTKGDFFQDILDALPDGIVVLDKSFNIISLNHAAETIFKISREKARGISSSTVLPEEMEEIAEKSILDERTVFGDEINPVLKGGERVSIQVVSSPLISDEGNALGVILQIKDLSSAKFLIEKNLQKSSASTLEGLLIGLTHELKNPLSGIKGAAQLLLQEKTIDVTEKCADIITKEVDRLCTLLDRLGQIEPLPKEVLEPVDIHDIISVIVFLESKSRDGKRVKFVENFDITLPPVLGNKDSLKQVFLNIIKNSIQAIPNRGSIEITTRWITDYKLKGEKAILVEIRDTGSGISKEILQKIYKPFYTTKKEGSGLGLFIAYQIIAKHGGAIFVESQLEKGTVFKVYLPIYINNEKR
ncbi:MAG: nitrogen-specific signal transduction histidine kinase NtrB [Candidatus Dadabacteria bacterium CSP1-2]|nr:MAG: nitrogen-specific signal transduction histidine kinase NtrB [Candidatus Dadabacteria bacterium CSP1-2]